MRVSIRKRWVGSPTVVEAVFNGSTVCSMWGETRLRCRSSCYHRMLLGLASYSFWSNELMIAIRPSCLSVYFVSPIFGETKRSYILILIWQRLDAVRCSLGLYYDHEIWSTERSRICVAIVSTADSLFDSIFNTIFTGRFVLGTYAKMNEASVSLTVVQGSDSNEVPSVHALCQLCFGSRGRHIDCRISMYSPYSESHRFQKVGTTSWFQHSSLFDDQKN